MADQEEFVDVAITAIDVALSVVLNDVERRGGDRKTVAIAIAAWMVSALHIGMPMTYGLIAESAELIH